MFKSLAIIENIIVNALIENVEKTIQNMGNKRTTLNISTSISNTIDNMF